MVHLPGTSVHLIADLDGCCRLDDAVHVEQVLRMAASAAKAHVVGVHLHHFGEAMPKLNSAFIERILYQ